MPQIPAQIEDDVRFWLGQDAEHNLFLALGFQDAPLKDQALRLHGAMAEALQKDDLGAALALVPQSQAFKQRALAQARQRWTGWNYPAFIDHLHREIDWMLVRRLARPTGLESPEELCAANQLTADHAVLAAYLLDPSEHALIGQALQLHGQAKQLAVAGCAQAVLPSVVAISRQALADADRFVNTVRTRNAASIIHPILAAHIDREGKRWLGRVSSIPVPVPRPGCRAA